jgi:adenylosuccinate lyase
MMRCYRAIFTFTSPLIALSPLDGRYQSKAAPLAPYFSESALMRYRIIV